MFHSLNHESKSRKSQISWPTFCIYYFFFLSQVSLSFLFPSFFFFLKQNITAAITAMATLLAMPLNLINPNPCGCGEGWNKLSWKKEQMKEGRMEKKVYVKHACGGRGWNLGPLLGRQELGSKRQRMNTTRILWYNSACCDIFLAYR